MANNTLGPGIKKTVTQAKNAAKAEAEAANVTPSAVMYSAPDGTATGLGETPSGLTRAEEDESALPSKAAVKGDGQGSNPVFHRVDREGDDG